MRPYLPSTTLMVKGSQEGEPAQGEATGKSRLAELGPVWISAIATLIASLVAVVGLLIANSGDESSTDSNSAILGAATVRGRDPLPPASSPPSVDECSKRLFIAVNGTAGPLTCTNGNINVLAWRHYAKTDPLVMTLGPNATPETAGAAMCADIKGETTTSREEETYRIAAVYYGWNFALDPTDFFPENC
jgi:hypothetical protein